MAKPALRETGQSTSQHYTYLLRIWRADANHPWRFTLRRVGGEETQYFPSLTAFVTMLWEHLKSDERV